MVRSAHWRSVDVLSLGMLIAMHVACLLAFVTRFSWSLVLLALGSYVLRMFAITAGYHRYFSHRSYKASRGFQFLLALIGTCSMQNGPLWWASWHRRHHKHADTTLDPHSPHHAGFWKAHIGWVLDPREESRRDYSNVKDLSRFPELRFLERHKWLPMFVYGAACFAIAGGAGLLWGFVISTVVLFHATLAINSLAHVWGSRRYATNDTSRNNFVLAVLTLGEGWHNNHHHHMNSARQGFLWWEIDVSYYVLRALARFRIVWDVREPNLRALHRGRIPDSAEAAESR